MGTVKVTSNLVTRSVSLTPLPRVGETTSLMLKPMIPFPLWSPEMERRGPMLQLEVLPSFAAVRLLPSLTFGPSWMTVRQSLVVLLQRLIVITVFGQTVKRFARRGQLTNGVRTVLVLKQKLFMASFLHLLLIRMKRIGISGTTPARTSKNRWVRIMRGRTRSLGGRGLKTLTNRSGQSKLMVTVSHGQLRSKTLLPLMRLMNGRSRRQRNSRRRNLLLTYCFRRDCRLFVLGYNLVIPFQRKLNSAFRFP